jgi:hypothetical protein
MTEVLTSVALEWANEADIVFYVYSEVEESSDFLCYVCSLPLCT